VSRSEQQQLDTDHFPSPSCADWMIDQSCYDPPDDARELVLWTHKVHMDVSSVCAALHCTASSLRVPAEAAASNRSSCQRCLMSAGVAGMIRFLSEYLGSSDLCFRLARRPIILSCSAFASLRSLQHSRVRPACMHACIRVCLASAFSMGTIS
jgi:hypothetical protein